MTQQSRLVRRFNRCSTSKCTSVSALLCSTNSTVIRYCIAHKLCSVVLVFASSLRTTPQLPVTEQLKPVRTSQLILRAKIPNSVSFFFSHTVHTASDGEKDWWIQRKTFKISHGAHSLMTKCLSCSPMRRTTRTGLLESDSIPCAFHRSAVPLSAQSTDGLSLAIPSAATGNQWSGPMTSFQD